VKSISHILVCLGIGYASYCHAQAQVVDATPIDPQLIQSQAPVLSLEQRVTRIEQQLQNRQQLDLSGQISGLQQALQELRGQIDMLDHRQKELDQRLNNFYGDLNRRLDAYKTQAIVLATASPTSSAKVGVKHKHAVQAAVQPAGEPATDNFPLANADEHVNMPAAQIEPASPLQEQNAYQTGYNALKNRSYPQAITSMESYLQQYPNGKYAASAHYWLGELYLVQKQLDKAAVQFNTVITQYPSDSKIADAKLKLGMVYYSKGQYPQAKTLLLEVKKQYPGSAAARLAEARLQGMANVVR
jgi:tol-pal system protein YbgF